MPRAASTTGSDTPRDALPRTWAVAVFAAALAVRLAAFLVHGRSLAFAKYLQGGALLAEGRLTGPQVLDFSPFYLELHALPLRLGLVPDLDALRLAQLALGALTCVLVAAIGARLAGRAAGLVAGLLAAIQGDLVRFDLVIEPETLLQAVVALAVWLAVRGRERGGAACWAAVGGLAALAAATRPSAVLIAPALGVVALAPPGPGRLRRTAWRVAALACGLAVVHSAWAARARAWSEGAVMSPGPVAFTGNNPSATGVWRSDFIVKDIEAQDPDPAVPDHAHEVFRQVALASGADPADPDRYWLDLAFSFVREHPGRWLALLGEKVLAIGQPHDPHDIESSLSLRERMAGWPLPGAWPLVAIGVAGLLVARRRLWPAGLAAVALAGTCVAFYVSARYRTALMPWMCIGAAGLAIDAVPRRWGGRGAWLGPVLAAALALLLVLPLPPGHALAAADAEARATHRIYAEAARLRGEDRYDQAAARIEECVAAAPWFADLYALAEVPFPLAAIGERRAPDAVALAGRTGASRDWLRAAMLLDFAGRSEAAIEAYARVRDEAVWPGERPVVQAAMLHRGTALLALRRDAEAADAFAAAADLAPGEPEALVGLSIARRDPAPLAAADAVNPSLEVRFLLGRALIDAGRPADAAAPLAEVVRALPGWPRARMLHAIALAGADRVRQAASEAARAQAGFPELFDPLHTPVDLMRRAALAFPEGDAAAWRRLATFAAVYGDLRTAMEAWQALSLMSPGGLGPEESARVGWLLVRHGRPADALPWLDRALAADPANARARAAMDLARSRM
ncbi:MAG: glycosyltransferase family 39 protein [Deltaproteobacteria bacterium]|nr:glycosyltransferase family 39 protein [Deltaproteobacteria bacterium]